MNGYVKKNCLKGYQILNHRFYFQDIVNHPLLPVVVLLVFSLLPVYYATLRWPCLADDSFITLTYSKNIATGRGFVYNYGEPTYGSTTPLLVLIGSVFGFLLPWFPLHFWVTLFTAFCVVGIGWVFLLFHKQFNISPWVAVFIGFSVIITSDPAFLGMEIFLFQFLLVLSCALAFCRYYFCCGVCIALLHLTRPEGVLLLPIIMSYVLVTDLFKGERDIHKILKPQLRMAVGAVVVAGMWFCYAYLTFGQILPNTLKSKIAHSPFIVGSRTFRNYWLVFVQNRFREWGGDFNLRKIFGGMIWLLVAFGVFDVIRYRCRWVVFILFFMLYMVVSCIINIEFFGWYALVLVFILFLLMALGWVRLVTWTLLVKPKTIAIVLVVLMTTAFFGIEINRFAQESKTKWVDYRAPAYLKVASWFRNNTKPGSTVSLGEVGYIGYFTDNKIIDLAGLVSPNIVPFLAKGDPITGFIINKPDYHILLNGCPFSEPITKREFFKKRYTQVARITGVAPRKVVYIYKRNDVL